jgi:hypothetical protein
MGISSVVVECSRTACLASVQRRPALREGTKSERRGRSNHATIDSTERTMATTLIHSYDTLFDAESAQQQLLASGFSSENIHLTVKEDDAGPVQGNFTVGNATSDNSAELDPGEPSGVHNDEVYERDFKDAVQRGTYLLTVDADDDTERQRASEILQRYGGVDLHVPTSLGRSRH